MIRAICVSFAAVTTAASGADLLTFIDDDRRVELEVLSDLPTTGCNLSSNRDRSSDGSIIWDLFQTSVVEAELGETHSVPGASASWTVHGAIDTTVDGDGFTTIGTTSAQGLSTGSFRLMNSEAVFSMTFEIDRPLSYRLDAVFDGPNFFTVIGTGYYVEDFGPGVVERVGTLGPGRYQVRAHGGWPRLTGSFGEFARTSFFHITFQVRDCPGDSNFDGVVDVGDLVAVVTDWGTPGFANGGDLDKNGTVDVGDLVLVIRNWGPCPDP